ncbi:MAG: SIMPL domain-containing protein [Lentimicrobiaceae bacterium]|nr:SIMPL domain-containing protein [Lentimicrobiaceae bacterium]
MKKTITFGTALFFGLIILGFFIYKGLRTFSDKDRVVTVKGLAEMNMTATASKITIDFTFSGDDLRSVIQQTENKKNSIISYLKKEEYMENDISLKNMDVYDRQTYYEYEWNDGKRVPVKVDRYRVSQSMTVWVNEVETTEDKAATIKLDLISNNLTSDIYTNYSFPELNDIKPQLIAESTKNARVAGEQFANDSQAKLGKIKTASQGQITIAGKYYYYDDESGSNTPEEPYIQKARVVSTIVFFLE